MAPIDDVFMRGHLDRARTDYIIYAMVRDPFPYEPEMTGLSVRFVSDNLIKWYHSKGASIGINENNFRLHRTDRSLVVFWDAMSSGQVG